MMRNFRDSAALAVLFLSASSTPATSIAPIKLEDLYAGSNKVMMVHIVSGDEEHYQYSETDRQLLPVCKAKILQNFKVAQNDDTIFIAPCSGFELSSNYILFADDAPPPHLIAGKERDSYGPIKTAERWSDAGYGMMLVEYACVFDGRVPASSCDYGIRLTPSQIILPKSLISFPKSEATAETNYMRWVRRDAFIAALTVLQSKGYK